MAPISDHTINVLVSRINVPAWHADRTARASHTLIEPFTGRPLADVPVGTADDVAAAFDVARDAGARWEKVDVRERAQVLNRFADLVHARRDDLMDIVQAETGKARMHVLDEIMDAMLVARHYAKKGPKLLAPRPIAGPIPGLSKARVVRRPVGVVGIIAPWNYPLSLAITDALAAIMAGNAIVLKPDSQTPLTALASVLLMEEAGMPAELFQVVTGPGRVVGSAITDTCDYLMFTGSSKTGSALGAQIGGRLVGYSAELGGKNPMIVDEGVDYERVAEIATRACFSNAGQLCVSIERIYAVGDAYPRMKQALTNRFSRMKLGAGAGWDIEMGTLSSVSQLETVTRHVDDAVSKGATVLTGGRPREDLGPFFYEPTLLADVPSDAECYRAETFGPVVSIYPASSLDDAIAQANDTEYGLNSSVFCKTSEDAQRVAERLNSGMVNVNEGFATAWSSVDGPSGGWGISGKGVRHGDEGILKYTRAKTIATQSTLLHFGGPKFMPRRVWGPALEHAANMLKWIP